MTDPEPRYHVLLIGIDNYANPDMALNGCVNDIDAIQRILLGRAKIPARQVKRLTSPHPGVKHETKVPEAPATLVNIRAAFEDLGSERVGPGDRVFVYYAGHGSRLEVLEGERTFHRETLVPADCAGWKQGPFLFDFELNQLIAGIVARTPAVTVILDCCQSAGATRDLNKGPALKARFADLGQTGPLTISPDLTGRANFSARGVANGTAPGVDQCQVVAGCLNHEQAKEEVEPGKDGEKHGLLTRALMTALGGMTASEVRTVPWGRIWPKVREEVESANPGQHLWMSGSLARAVLGGPPVDGDFGLGISRTDARNRYEIDAGTLAGITVGARLAVYGDKPFKFPPLDSSDDVKARVGKILLKVTAATRSSATAEAEGAPFDLPPGARGRLVKAGEDEKLRCAMVPENGEVTAALAASPVLQVTPEDAALVRLERQSDGSWALTDDVHGAREGQPALFTLAPAQLGKARAVLEQYVRYALPLRMARRCTDLPGALQIRFLASPRFTGAPTDAERAALPELPMAKDSVYQLSPGTTFAVRIHNTSNQLLRVVLLASEASGNVAWLGDQIIDAKGTYEFWRENTLANPFEASLPEGSTQCLDRVVAIGTTALDKDLKYLSCDTTFADAVNPSRTLSKSSTPPAPPVDQWTATEILVRTR